MTAWRDKTPLPMHIVELDNVPQSQKISQLSHLCFIKITVEPHMGRTVPPQCAWCQQFYHVAANCQAPPACTHCAEEHCSWQCENRFLPNFVPTCALCKIGEHGSKYRGCPFFHDLMERETKSRPPQENSKRIVGARVSAQPQRPPPKTFRDFPPMGAANAWSRPLNFVSSQLTQPPPHPYSFHQPRDLYSTYHFTQPHIIQQHARLAHSANCPCCVRSNTSTQATASKPPNSVTGIYSPVPDRPVSPAHSVVAQDVTHAESSLGPKSRPLGSKTKATKGNNTEQLRQGKEEYTGQRDTHTSHERTQQYPHPPTGLRLGNPHTQQQTREFVEINLAHVIRFTSAAL